MKKNPIFKLKTLIDTYVKSVMECLFYEGNEVHFYLDNELMFEAKADSGSDHRVRAPRLKKNWGCFCKL